MGPARTGSWKCGVLGLPPGVLWKHHGHGGHEIYLRAVACNGCIARIRHIGRSCYSKFTSSIINLHQTSSNYINLPKLPKPVPFKKGTDDGCPLVLGSQPVSSTQDRAVYIWPNVVEVHRELCLVPLRHVNIMAGSSIGNHGGFF